MAISAADATMPENKKWPVGIKTVDATADSYEPEAQRYLLAFGTANERE
jgi:hypothetical protein